MRYRANKRIPILFVHKFKQILSSSIPCIMHLPPTHTHRCFGVGRTFDKDNVDLNKCKIITVVSVHFAKFENSTVVSVSAIHRTSLPILVLVKKKMIHGKDKGHVGCGNIGQ